MRNLSPFPLIAACVLLVLGGCTTLSMVSDYNVSQNTLDTIISGYDAAFLAPAKNYRDLYDINPCLDGQKVSNDKGLCAQKDVVLGLQKAGRVVDDAIKAVQGQLDQCKAADPTGKQACKGVGAIYATLKTAIAAAESYATNYGVK